MTSSMPTVDWLGFLEREYLGTFIPRGGSAIKFAVPLDAGGGGSPRAPLSSLARRLGFVVAEIDAADAKIQFPEQIFFRIASNIDWILTAEAVLNRFVSEGRDLPAPPGDSPFLTRLAEANQIDEEVLLTDFRPRIRHAIANRVFRQRGLSKDFRVAMTGLCNALLSGGADGDYAKDALLDWLTGRNTTVGAVRHYGIFTRIARNNARHHLQSLFHWLRFSGRPGGLVLLDVSRVSVSRNPRDELLFYTKNAVKDVYEVLRQFIDGIDRLEGCLMVVIAHPDFLDDDRGGRGMGSYEALMFRIVDEVRDRDLANPMASLVRLTGA
ncbi:MAG: hypothetical protein GEU28_02730 [Dehalococcoidia bacterium]|nr:hypothetical protein [Dehalococcoidia bacterium]